MYKLICLVIAQELVDAHGHSAASSNPRGCGVPLKLIRKYFGARESYLEKHELLYLYSSLEVGNHSRAVKFIEKAVDYIQQNIFER